MGTMEKAFSEVFEMILNPKLSEKEMPPPIGDRTNKPVTASGGNVDYYMLVINHPKRLTPYRAEAEDIIEALNMTFAEGNAFKAIWRSCAARTLGVVKEGMDASGVYDAQKVEYYGARMVAQRKLKKEMNVKL